MKLNLQDNITSRQDFKAAISDIRQYARWVSQSSIKKKVAAGSAEPPPAISEAAAGLIRQWQADEATARKGLDELIAALDNFAAAAPHVTITLAAPAPAKLKQEMVAWFRKNVRPDILVDFNFNATMLGGMMVRYGSRVFDWSFKRQILGSRQKFPEVLRRV